MEHLLLPHIGKEGLKIIPDEGIDAKIINEFQKVVNDRIYEPKTLKDPSEKLANQEDAVRILLQGLAAKGENSTIVIQGGPNLDISPTLRTVEEILNQMYQNNDYIPSILGYEFRTLVPKKGPSLVHKPSEIVAAQNFQRPSLNFTLPFESLGEAREFKRDIDKLGEFVLETLRKPEFRPSQICEIKDEESYEKDYSRLEKRLASDVRDVLEGFEWEGGDLVFRLVGRRGDYSYEFNSSNASTRKFLASADEHTREEMREQFRVNFEDYLKSHQKRDQKLREKHTENLTNALLRDHIHSERMEIAKVLVHSGVDTRINADYRRNKKKTRAELEKQSSNLGKVDYFIEILSEKWGGEEVNIFLNQLYNFIGDPTVLRKLKAGETQIRESLSGRHDFIGLIRPVIVHEITDPTRPYTLYIESRPIRESLFGSLDDTIYNDQPEHERAIPPALATNSIVYLRNAEDICREGDLVQNLRTALREGSFQIPRDIENAPKNLDFIFNTVAKPILHFDENAFNDEDEEIKNVFEELKTYSTVINWSNHTFYRNNRERKIKEQNLVNLLSGELNSRQEENPTALAKYSTAALNVLVSVAKAMEMKVNRLSTDHERILNFAEKVAGYTRMQLKTREVKPKHIHSYLRDSRFKNRRYHQNIDFYLDLISLPPTEKHVGRVHGLHYTDDDGMLIEEGHPALIEASLSSGSGKEILSVETDAGLMDSSYIKGSGDATAFLQEKFGKPIYFDTRITWRSCYEESGGPSGSAAEVYTILSKLANVPLSQKIAVTGTISNPSGDVGKIGGVYGKVRGAYDCFKALSKRHKEKFEGYGAMIPLSNVEEFMLKLQLDPELSKEISSGNFNVYVHSTIDEGFKILSGEELKGKHEKKIKEKITKLGKESKGAYGISIS